MTNKEELVINYVERYGIIEYKVKGNVITYYETFYGEGKYKVEYNVKTKEEKRKLVKKGKNK